MGRPLILAGGRLRICARCIELGNFRAEVVATTNFDPDIHNMHLAMSRPLGRNPGQALESVACQQTSQPMQMQKESTLLARVCWLGSSKRASGHAGRTPHGSKE
jgi:hypothetical protein